MCTPRTTLYSGSNWNTLGEGIATDVRMVVAATAAVHHTYPAVEYACMLLRGCQTDALPAGRRL
ncbi:hypothetical protein TWF481_010656 [Arthrobotrys musiformis]|uniref:Uncharacterized protein n=1 Tax=Arthrobotrys musiformis TaxID=47236 RepID=A0AAV9W1J2_9PEZI